MHDGSYVEKNVRKWKNPPTGFFSGGGPKKIGKWLIAAR
jgi:hypothetical protein